ncbi:MAG: RsmD family RNA methyltransferase [Phycisphaerales bacterium]|nr:MAG: RsmD family RNA methyltransferase [Phycisphaerales bacterium]
MRIIAGRWRSRALLRPSGEQTRPMPDRVKEAVFDILGSLLTEPGSLPPVPVADVFAGSGALGLEAMSRGAAVCYFFERHPHVLAVLRANVQALDAGADARIMPVDAWQAPWHCVAREHLVKLLLVDPPFRDSRDASAAGKVGRFLARAAASDRIAADAIALLHHEKCAAYDVDEPAGWRRFDARCYGINALTFFRRC